MAGAAAGTFPTMGEVLGAVMLMAIGLLQMLMGAIGVRFGAILPIWRR